MTTDDDDVIEVDEMLDGGGLPRASSITQSDVDDIINDPTLPLAQRRALLESLLGRVGDEDLLDRGDDYVPLDMRITDALAMLAEGGHDYGATEATGIAPQPRSDGRSTAEIDDTAS